MYKCSHVFVYLTVCNISFVENKVKCNTTKTLHRRLRLKTLAKNFPKYSEEAFTSASMLMFRYIKQKRYKPSSPFVGKKTLVENNSRTVR